MKERNKKLVLATSKPEEFAVKILKYFQLYEYFDVAAGASMDSSRSKKADVIAYALDRCQVTDRSEAIMVGDREQDILGAKQVGLKSIGVLFGYGDYEELSKAGANYIAENVQDILRLICGEE